MAVRHRPTDIAEDPGRLDRQGGRNVLTSFDPRSFVEHAAWRRLSDVLERGGGGNYAIAGPRGTGKTWMMFRASAWANDRGGLGVTFQGQGDHPPMDFVASLTETLATAFEEWYDARSGRPVRLVRRRIAILTAFGLLLLYLALVALNVNGSFFSGITWLDIGYDGIALALFPAGIAAWLLIVAFRYRREFRDGAGRVRCRAVETRRQMRYVTSLRETSEIGAEAGRAGLIARFRHASEMDLVERPSTLSGLVQNFRGFASEVSGVVGELVICIDELDKMRNPTDVADLIRHVEGVLEIPRAFVIVALSEGAAYSGAYGSAVPSGGFDSDNCFDQVFCLDVFVPSLAVEVIRARGGLSSPEAVRTACVLAGGAPREFVRKVEEIDSCGATTVAEAATAVARAEVDTFKRALFGTHDDGTSSPRLDQDKLTVHLLLSDWDGARSSGAGALASTPMSALRYWTIDGTSRQWREQFEERWQGLLVRLAVAGVLMRDTEGALVKRDLDSLQSIVCTSFQSALVARALFLEDFRERNRRESPGSAA
ncbi:hypothetical protein [Kitasatospora sp. NPDC085464]|uniref:hypothetical protein n=1 Tax=Kitasatospora sp. NPDC085464 TaxID=3364063 RepID=UPI0037CB3FA5